MSETLVSPRISEQSAIEARFAELAAVWKEETMPLSSSSQITAHPAYQKIIEIGPAAIPLLLRELEQRPDHWFAALRALTGANPVQPEQQGRVEEMAAAWLQWGKGTRLYMVNRLEALFPKLAADGYRITSAPTIFYNCLAWAAGENWRWWWPDVEYYWPDSVPRTVTLQAFTQAYETLGYEVCTDAGAEQGYEKIALYADASGTPTHAARQLTSGLWSSKIGRDEDIEHVRLESFTGGIYGEVTLVMRRIRKNQP